MKQMGITKRIIIVASENVQDNFKLQLFDERKLKEVDGIWTIKGCLGNKLLKEINPTGMTWLSKEKVIHWVKNLINSSYSFQGYTQFSNDIFKKAGRKSDSLDTRIRNLQYEYSDSLIVIDEVHNIRISDDNENKYILEYEDGKLVDIVQVKTKSPLNERQNRDSVKFIKKYHKYINGWTLHPFWSQGFH